MTGGFKGNASRVAIAAVFCVMGASVFAHKPARAADLGGDCCADLEERVAELEATTARKGNKKVTVIVYGKVNYAAMSWDDGHEQGTYTVNNYMESTRFGFKGTAKINDDWSAGFRLEAESRVADSQRLNQFNDNNANDPLGPINMRWAQIFLTSKKLGEVRMGLTATPKYDVTKDTMEYISTESGEGGGLSDTMVADFRMNDAFLLRPKGFDNAEGLSTLRWQDIARCYGAADQFNCSTRRNGVAYWSPTWNGFSASVGEFEDKDWGAALRYKNTWADTWAFAASAGYEQLRDERLQSAGGGSAGFSRDIQEEAGSAAIKNKPTGLFLFGAWSLSQNNDSNAIGAFNDKGAPDMGAWNIQGGIQRKVPWFGLDKLGETAFWGGFSDVNNGFAQGSFPIVSSNNDPILAPATGNTSATNPQDTKLGGVLADGLIRSTAFPTPKGKKAVLPAHGSPCPAFVANADNCYQVVGTDVTNWTLAFDQQLEAAAMHLYAVYQHFDQPDFNVIDSSGKHISVPLNGFDLVYVGGRLYF
jgi:predicted porin